MRVVADKNPTQPDVVYVTGQYWHHIDTDADTADADDYKLRQLYINSLTSKHHKQRITFKNT